MIDLSWCSVLNVLPGCFVPALFVHGEKDDFITPAHSERLYEKYAGEKNRILVPGGLMLIVSCVCS